MTRNWLHEEGGDAQRKCAGPNVLIVDDDRCVRDALVRALGRQGVKSVGTSSFDEALCLLADCRIAVVLVNLLLPDVGGVDALRKIWRAHPGVRVIALLPPPATVEFAIQCMKCGVADGFSKPFDSVHRVIAAVTELLEGQASALPSPEWGDEYAMIAESMPMRELLDAATATAAGDCPVLIQGETGTGKELLARRIHRLSARSSGPFVPVNCGGLPETLLDSELFGHSKGAFTGAFASSRGLFRAADGGTIFLDEIGELSLAAQAKLLRVLQGGEVRAVGDTRIERADARVIAASNRDLQVDVAEGRFRADLYYRLAVVSLWVPPLRDRTDDIPSLARYFLRQACRPSARSPAIGPDALAAMSSYSWPGNVRELKNVVERACVLGVSDALTIFDLPSEIRRVPLQACASDTMAIRPFDRATLEHALRAAQGSSDEAARLMGVSRATFYRRMRQEGLSIDRAAPAAERTRTTGRWRLIPRLSVSR